MEVAKHLDGEDPNPLSYLEIHPAWVGDVPLSGQTNSAAGQTG